MQYRTDTQDVIEITQLAVEPKLLDPGRIYAVMQDNRVEVLSTMLYADKPQRQTRRVKTYDVESFITYLSNQGVCVGCEEIFAADDGLAFIAVLNPTGWRDDTVRLYLHESPEWKAWTRISGQLDTQERFAEFLQDQLSTIVNPEGANLLEIVQSMQGHTNVEWKSAAWLANGQRGFVWDETVEAKAGQKGTVEIPSQFKLALRPFLGSDPFEVKANLRYRIISGQLSIGFKLVEPEKRRESAFADVVTKIESELEVTVMRGWPE